MFISRIWKSRVILRLLGLPCSSVPEWKYRLAAHLWHRTTSTHILTHCDDHAPVNFLRHPVLQGGGLLYAICSYMYVHGLRTHDDWIPNSFRPRFNSHLRPYNNRYELSYFQLPFFSISSFWDHQTFLFKTSNLRNHLPSKCREGRVISHIKGLP